ncbi:MAG: DUF4982 domain-containing protein [Clostridiales bacterium]|nr:DUF4982 domain-containing protein [Clostridiales bacterium]
MKHIFHITLFSLILAAVALPCNAAHRERLDTGWLTKGNFEIQYVKPDFNDSRWQTVTLPHDWSLQSNPDSTANAGNDGGYLPGLDVTYRRVLHIDSVMPGNYRLYFEGAYMNPTIWVNGEEIDSHTYGYTSFGVDITEALTKGDNVIAVNVDNSEQKNSRWYTGTGLYRPVWLEHRAPLHIEPNSMFITSPGIRPGMAIGRMEAMILDSSDGRTGEQPLMVTFNVTDPDGNALEPVVQALTLAPGEHAKPLLVDFPIPDPQLWSPDTPLLYTATLTLNDGNRDTDSETVTFGLRTFDYDAEEGAFLNDKPILINGACVHHDNGMLGAAAYDAAEWHKVMQLKRAGFNAVRTSHNPPSTAFLNACDHLGLLVIDEAFDGWAQAKTPHDYSTVFESQWPVDLDAMVSRDRNHPSIIAWSIGNEILERKQPEAVETAAEMVALCKRLDPTRPVTQALASWDNDWEIYDPLAAQHDIIGYNYMIDKVEGDHQRDPERVVWQTESYPRDAFSNYLKVRDLPYVIGDFVWTGIDYIGESGIGRHYYDGEVPGEHYERNLWPWHNAMCGDIDFIGQRKPISYYRDMLHNNLDTIVIAVREPDGYNGKIQETKWGTYPTSFSWNWPGHEGKPIEVEVYTRYPSVRLFLDGKPVGTAPVKVNESTAYKATVTLPYRPGTLKAVAYDSKGKSAAADSITTAGPSKEIAVDYERVSVPSVDYDLIFLTASIVDDKGNVNTLDNSLLTFAVNDGATILGTATADPTDPIGYTRPNRQAYHGRVGAVIKAQRHFYPTLTISSVSLPTFTKILGNGTRSTDKK